MPDYPIAGKAYGTPGEEIVGIPDKNVIKPIRLIAAPEKWELTVHRHEARKAGLHSDLRLLDPETGDAHSWALRHWPKPGEKRLAIVQPTHSKEYMTWEGKIESGYGAGEVSVADHRPIQVTRASPEKVTFGSGAEKYSLIKTPARGGKAWILLNHGKA